MTDCDTLHQLLAEATPAQRLTHLLALIESAPTLILPERDGEKLTLHGIRLDPESLQTHLAGRDKPGWWVAETGGIDLQNAVCRGANFQESDLSSAELARADFSDANLRAAKFAQAGVEAACFERADMTGVDFSAARASEANFAAALLEDARFGHAILRFARFEGALLDSASFERADAWGAAFTDAEASYVNFRHAGLQEAAFANADCSGADFTAADLKKANFQGACLKAADLRNTELAGADFAGADLSETSLTRLNLTSCTLTHVRLDGAWLEGTRFSIEQLGGAVGEETARDYAAARRAYLGVERNFRSLGDPEAASWAYRRARRMGKHAARQDAGACWRARNWRGVLGHGFAALSDAFSEWLCDYGESMPRVLRAYVLALVGFAALYGLTGSLLRIGPNGAAHPTLRVVDLLSFSFLAMSTSLSSGTWLKPSREFFYFVASGQYVLGVVLIGLFGYVLGNRIRR